MSSDAPEGSALLQKISASRPITFSGSRGFRQKNLQTKDSNTPEKGCVLCHFAACNLKNRH